MSRVQLLLQPGENVTQHNETISKREHNPRSGVLDLVDDPLANHELICVRHDLTCRGSLRSTK